MRYFDVHSHIFPANIAGKVIQQLETYYGYRWEGTGEQADLIDSMDASGVTRSVIFSCATKPQQVVSINNYIASLQREFPDRFLGFGTMHPDFENPAEELHRIRSLGLKGLKFHPDFQNFRIDDPKMLKIYEAAGDSLVLLFHTGDPKSDFSSPTRLANVLRILPGLRVIAAHMGGYMAWEEAMDQLIGKDLYLDISSTIPHAGIDLTRKFVTAHGADRVLFASDYPAVRHARAIADVESLGFPDEVREKIYHKNAEKLLDFV